MSDDVRIYDDRSPLRSLERRIVNSHGQEYKVLVVDDSPVYRKLIEQILFSQPYRLLYAPDGKEALQLYRDHSPAIVITDWMMPDVSGVDLCRQIRLDGS